MISVGKMTPGHAQYFEGEVAAGREDYYAGRGEAPGVWRGSGAASAGLEGEVLDGQLGRLFDMRHPITNDPLGPVYNVSSTYVDRFGNEQIRHKRAAFDLTFSVPKSVSTLYAHADPELQGRIVEGVEAGADAAIAHLERHAAFSRTGKSGVRQVDTEGLTVARYMHRTSRAGDPQLHMHLLVSNRVLCEDGVYRALDGRNLFPEIKTADMVGNLAMRAELESIGVEWGPVAEHGYAEIVDVPDGLMDLYSKRTKQVEGHAQPAIAEAEEALQRTLTPAERAEKYNKAAVETRAVKSRDLDVIENLGDRWQAEAIDAGFDPGEWLPNVTAKTRRQQQDSHPQYTDSEIIDQSLTVLTDDRSAWGRTEATREISRLTPHHGTSGTEAAVRVEGLTEQLLASDHVVEITVAPPQPVDGRVRSDGLSEYERHNAQRYTTVATLEREQRILDYADAGRDAGRGIAPAAHVEAAIQQRATAGQPLSADQQAALERITLSGEGLVSMVGPAGTGKSKTLEAVNDAYQRAGTPVRGLAPSAKAAAVLRTEAGIEQSDTLAKLLHENFDNPNGPAPDQVLRRGEIVVLDEASMAATADLDRLVTLVDRADAKLVAVGDYRQLGSVKAGGMFRLVSEHDSAELDQVWRFTNDWEREASLRLRHGDTTVIGEYERHGRIRGGTRDEMLDQAFTVWAEQREARQSFLVTSRDRDTVTEFNTRARHHLKQTGAIAQDGITTNGTEISVGDEILTLRNDRRLGVTDGTNVRNGDRWRVEAHRDDGGLSVRRLDAKTREARTVLPVDYLEQGNVDHAYATTVYKAQGVTVNGTGHIADQASNAESLYVALTRGTDQNMAFVVTEAEITEFGIETGPTPEPTEILTAALQRETAEHSAIEQWRDHHQPTEVGREPEHASPTQTERPGASELSGAELRELWTEQTDLRMELKKVEQAAQREGLNARGDARQIHELRRTRNQYASDLKRVDYNLDNLNARNPIARRRDRKGIANYENHRETVVDRLAEAQRQLDNKYRQVAAAEDGLGGRTMVQRRFEQTQQRVESRGNEITEVLDGDRNVRADRLHDQVLDPDQPTPRINKLGDAANPPDPINDPSLYDKWLDTAARIDQHQTAWTGHTPAPGTKDELVRTSSQREVAKQVKELANTINPPQRGIERGFGISR